MQRDALVQFLRSLNRAQTKIAMVDPLYGAASTVVHLGVLIISADFVQQVRSGLADPVEQYPCH